jgi:hypothetical protein
MMEDEVIIGKAEEVKVRFVGNLYFKSVAVISFEINCFIRNLNFQYKYFEKQKL